MSNIKMPKGNRQIAFRVEPSLEVAIQQAMREDGDETISAWLKHIIRKELQQRAIEPKGWHMTKEQKNSLPGEAKPTARPMQFPLESFLKKLKEDQRKKSKADPEG